MGARNPFAAKPVISRRGGPVKEPLSRETIVATALDLLTREGLEGMSLRKVAAALDTGAASLYAYVEDLQELRALVLDRALADVRIPRPHEGDWRSRLRALLSSYEIVLSRHAGLGQLAMTVIAVGPNALRILETLLGLLEEAGVDETTASWAVDLITLYVTALAAEQGQRQHDSDPLGALARVIDDVTPGQYPRIHAVRSELLSGTGPDRFAWALDALLKGVLETPRAQHPAADPHRPRKPKQPR